MTICSECASRLGYIPKDKVVGIWTAECDFCHEVRSVCDCAHDYWPPMKQCGMNEITIAMRRETVADILKEMANVDDNGRDWCRRIKAAHKAVADELAKQCEYDAKLEADFAALLKDCNELAEKSRLCCAEIEGLHNELERAIEELDAEDEE